MLQLRPYQETSMDGLREGFVSHRAQMLYLPTGSGKCLGINTPVILSDGSIKLVQDVVVGDRLIGPDGCDRNVLGLARGREMLYRITPIKGDSYVVNASHILSLKITKGADAIVLSDGSRIEKGCDVANINVEVLLNSNKTAKHCLKGWRSGAIEFNSVKEDLLLDPYWLGAWLGDGLSRAAAIAKPYCGMVKWWIDHGESAGHTVTEYKYRDDDCSVWNVVGKNQVNIFSKALGAYGLIKNKHIPACYIKSSVDNRLKLIAGLIDSDGSLGHNGYDWISKNESVAMDFAFICRSVGLAAYISPCKKGIKKTGFVGDYWRVSVSGNTDLIPCLDKKAAPREQTKRHLVHGIKIEKIGIGDFYGFEIDGDKLFLLGDFTVTHNTEIAIGMLAATAEKGNRAAMVLDRRILCDQTSARLDKYGIDHGVLMSGHWRYRPEKAIQVCSAQTLEARGSFPGLKLLIVDEAHTVRKSVTEFIKNNHQVRVVGLSASPFTKGLGSIYSNIVSRSTTRDLVDEGTLAPLRVFLAKEIDMDGAKKVAGEWSQKEATDRGVKITGDIVSEWAQKTHEIFGGPKKTIVFCAGLAHGADLAQKFADAGYNFVSISYKDDDDRKQSVINDFSKPDTDIHGLIATDILTKGFDQADVMIGISARPFTKSFSSHVQQLGRIMRPHPDKSAAVWLDHSGNFLRFRDQWEALYSGGVDELDDESEKSVKEPTKQEKEAAKCPKCAALWPSNSDVCSNCGHVRARKNNVVTLPGEMIELSGQKKEKYDSATKERWYGMLLGYAKSKGYQDGFAFHKYIEKFGIQPSWKKVAASPDAEIMKWITSRNIAWSKRKVAA